MAQTPNTIKRNCVIFAVVYLIVVGIPTVYNASRSKSGQDYASYHYAAEAVWSESSPFQVANLNVHSRQDRTRKRVHPFFYPPPAVLFFLWSPFFALTTSFTIFVVLSNLCWLGTVWIMRKLTGASWKILALTALFYTPVSDSMKMGQVNLCVLFLLLLAYQRSNGLLISLPAMIKMSPALVVFQWLGAVRWKAVLMSGIGAIGLSLVTLFAVDFSEQLRFYTEIFPKFSTGPYHGLTVPVSLPANHSIADIWNQIWPGPLRVSGQGGFIGKTGIYELSQTGRLANSISTACLFIVLCVTSFFKRDRQSQLALFGLSCVIMTITPLYAYEHHLVFVAFPLVLSLHALERKIISSKWIFVLGPSTICLAVPLFILRGVQKRMPEELSWFFQESKFFALLGLGACCLYLSLKGLKVLQVPSEDSAHLQDTSNPE